MLPNGLTLFGCGLALLVALQFSFLCQRQQLCIHCFSERRVTKTKDVQRYTQDLFRLSKLALFRLDSNQTRHKQAKRSTVFAFHLRCFFFFSGGNNTEKLFVVYSKKLTYCSLIMDVWN